MTEVIYRKYKNGDIIALFPYEMHDYKYNCVSYMRLGQHGEADYNGVVRSTKPATFNEFESLHRELVGQGYDSLKVITRVNRDKVTQAIHNQWKRNDDLKIMGVS